MDLLVGLLGSGIGAGIMAILNAALQRKWKRQDQQHVIVERLDQLSGRLDQMEADNEEREIKLVRIRLLRFGDECSHEVRHSREHFEQVIEDVDAYESYCREHPNFKNNKAMLTIQIIKETYQRRLVNNDFI